MGFSMVAQFALVVIAVALAAFIFVEAVVVPARHAQRQGQLLKEQAAKRGGQVWGGTLLGYGTLVFDHQGQSIEVSPQRRNRYGSWYSLPRTYIRCRLNPPVESRLRVRRRGLLDGLRRLAGRQSIEADYKEFDDSFVVQGDEATARKVLVQEVREALLQLAPSQPVLSLREDLLFLSVSHIPATAAGCDRLIDTVLAVLARLKQ